MKSMKLFYTVVGGVAALGIVLMGAGFAMGGFDPRVFSMSINAATGQVVLGGKEVADYEDIPLISDLMNLGMIDTDLADGDDTVAPAEAAAAPVAVESASPAAPSESGESGARLAIPSDSSLLNEGVSFLARQALFEKAIGWWNAIVEA